MVTGETLKSRWEANELFQQKHTDRPLNVRTIVYKLIATFT